MSALSAWLTWGALSFFYLLQFLFRIITNVINDQVIEKYAIDADGIGQFAGVWYVGYVLFHIPVGLILDHFSAKKVVPLCVLISVVGFAPIIYSDNFDVVVWGRFLVGAGCSASALGAFKLLMIAFGENKFPRMVGAMATIGLFGAAFGTGPIESLILKYGWKEVMHFIMYFGLLTMVLCYICLPNTKYDAKFSMRSVWNDLIYIVTKYRLLIFCFCGGLLIGPLEGFADAWSNKYLRVVYGLSHETAGGITTMIYLGMGIGFIFLGYIFEKTKSYLGIIGISGFVMIISFSMIILQLTHSPLLLGILFFIIGFFSAYQILVISKAIVMVDERHSTLVSAIANMIMMGCGFFFHTIMGKIIKYLDLSYELDFFGLISCHLDNYFFSFMTINLAMVIGTIGIALIAIYEAKIKKIKN
jgi:predicted MFS family arabinose efflux permease